MTALRNAITNSSCLLHQDTPKYGNILKNEALNKIHYRGASVLILLEAPLYYGYLRSSPGKKKKILGQPVLFYFILFFYSIDSFGTEPLVL